MPIESHDIDGPAGRLRLWEAATADPEAAVLFVHGATYAGRSIFAPAALDPTWLRWTATDGRSAFAVDLRGYGESERPPAMDDPDTQEPPVRAAEAAEDVRAALGAVREEVDGPVHLVGTSWGTMIAGHLLTESDAPNVASLTLHAPVFEPDPSLVEQFDAADPPPTRKVTRAEARDRWDAQVPTDPPAAIREAKGGTDPVFDAFWSALADSGQGVEGEDAIVAPNGTLADIAAAAAGERPYDPAALDVPTLVVRGSLDPTSTREDALGVYDALDLRDDEAVYAEIEGGTHFVHLERRRTALFEAVGAFQRQYPPR
jgi:pimeloyl-ACP methyl ester carboxylesterase